MTYSRSTTYKAFSLMNQRLSRRKLLKLAAGGVVSGGIAGCAPRIPSVPFTDEFGPLSAADLSILRAVQEHLLPSSADSPGAVDVNASAYLNRALTGIDIDQKDVDAIRGGIPKLRQISRDLFGASFESLEEADREKVLRAYEDKDDTEWLTLVMSYALEAYLGDPVYGGNPDGIVWRWLGHTPSSPRPIAGSQFVRR